MNKSRFKCQDCGIDVSWGAERCRSCSSKVRNTSYPCTKNCTCGKHVISESRRRNISKAFTPERRESYRSTMLGNTRGLGAHWKREPFTQSHKDKLRAKKLGNTNASGHICVHSEQTRDRLKSSTTALWLDASYRSRVIEGVAIAFAERPTSIELFLLEYVKNLYPNENVILQYPVDRAIIDVAIPSLFLAFEADGEYWHSNAYQKGRDKKRDWWLRRQGWKVKRYRESEIKSWKITV